MRASELGWMHCGNHSIEFPSPLRSPSQAYFTVSRNAGERGRPGSVGGGFEALMFGGEGGDLTVPGSEFGRGAGGGGFGGFKPGGFSGGGLGEGLDPAGEFIGPRLGSGEGGPGELDLVGGGAESIAFVDEQSEMQTKRQGTIHNIVFDNKLTLIT
jgi:hypothetical protein